MSHSTWICLSVISKIINASSGGEGVVLSRQHQEQLLRMWMWNDDEHLVKSAVVDVLQCLCFVESSKQSRTVESCDCLMDAVLQVLRDCISWFPTCLDSEVLRTLWEDSALLWISALRVVDKKRVAIFAPLIEELLTRLLPPTFPAGNVFEIEPRVAECCSDIILEFAAVCLLEENSNSSNTSQQALALSFSKICQFVQQGLVQLDKLQASASKKLHVIAYFLLMHLFVGQDACATLPNDFLVAILVPILTSYVQILSSATADLSKLLLEEACLSTICLWGVRSTTSFVEALSGSRVPLARLLLLTLQLSRRTLPASLRSCHLALQCAPMTIGAEDGMDVFVAECEGSLSECSRKIEGGSNLTRGRFVAQLQQCLHRAAPPVERSGNLPASRGDEVLLSPSPFLPWPAGECHCKASQEVNGKDEERKWCDISCHLLFVRRVFDGKLQRVTHQSA